LIELFWTFIEWVLDLIEVVSGRIDPGTRALLGYVVAAVAPIGPALAIWRVGKMVRAKIQGERSEVGSVEAREIANAAIDKRVAELMQAAEAIARAQASHARIEPTEAAIAEAAKRIAAVAETAAGGQDTEQHDIAEALAAKDVARAERLLGARLERKARAGRQMQKEAAEAARGLAALKRLADVAAAARLYRQAADLEPGNLVTWADAGDFARDAGSLGAAREAFARGLDEAIRRQDQWWQMAFENRLGDLDVAAGDLAKALSRYQLALSFADRLAKADPGNAGWQRDLSVSHNKIGDVLTAQGNLPAALDAFKASLAIAMSLAKADPGNAGWQRDLAISHGRVAMIEARGGEKAQALGAFRAGREIIARLKAASPDNATLPKDLAWFDAQIAALEGH
jgi:tetratricopeptide (TPR) repeat protein